MLHPKLNALTANDNDPCEFAAKVTRFRSYCDARLRPAEVLDAQSLLRATYGIPENGLLAGGDGNAKLKVDGTIAETSGISLMPSRLLCASATPGCLYLCLGAHAGHNQSIGNRASKARRTRAIVEHTAEFETAAAWEISRQVRKAARRGVPAACRLNLYSDLPYENIFPAIFSAFPEVQFYDYTKHRARIAADYNLPENYHLTFSYHENLTDADALAILDAGASIAVVFRETIPSTYLGRQVINGIETDARYLDPSGVFVGLVAKGSRARRDRSGFVVDESDPRRSRTIIESRKAYDARKRAAA